MARGQIAPGHLSSEVKWPSKTRFEALGTRGGIRIFGIHRTLSYSGGWVQMSELEKKESIRISPVGHISIYVRKRPTKPVMILWTVFSEISGGAQPGLYVLKSMDSKSAQSILCTQLPGNCGFHFEKTEAMCPTRSLPDLVKRPLGQTTSEVK